MTVAPVIRIVVGARDALARNVLRRVCDAGGIHVVGEGATVVDVIELARDERPDVVIVVEALVDGRVEDCLEALLGADCRVIVMSGDRAPDQVVSLLARGISGFLKLDASPGEVAEAVRAVAGGEAVLHPSAARTILDQWRSLRRTHLPSGLAPRATLTARERDVLVAMTEGMSAKAIARHLGVAVKTIENHKIRIFDKLGVRTHAHAVSVAIGQGLLVAARTPVEV